MKKNLLAHAVLAATLGGVAVAASAADDPNSFSANIGVVSNYLWRGVTQTQDGPAVQGGLDYAHESGFYAGTWASNIDWNNEGGEQSVTIPLDPATGLPQTDADGNFTGTTSGSSNPDSPNYELDLYLGFSKSLTDDLSFDVGTILYAYPDGRDSNFAELYAKGTWKWFTLGVAWTYWGQPEGDPNKDDALFREGDFYYSGSIDFGLPYDFGMSLFGGYYDFEYNDGTDYAHWGVKITRSVGDFGEVAFAYEQIGRDSGVYDTDPKFWVGWSKTF